jgi:hypothetical protein
MMPRAFHAAPGRENARAYKEYASVIVRLLQRTDAGLLVDRDDLFSPVWIPKRALDTHGKLQVERAALGCEVEIGIELKMALERGLV